MNGKQEVKADVELAAQLVERKAEQMADELINTAAKTRTDNIHVVAEALRQVFDQNVDTKRFVEKIGVLHKDVFADIQKHIREFF